jgi:phosphoglycolate phosphatase
VISGVDFRGMTDGPLLRSTLGAIGCPDDDQAVAQVVDVYLRHLERTVASAEDFRVLPGVRALLDALAPRAHLALGLGTGNVERGARIKLERAGLNHYFAFGGFGSDGEERAELLRIGAERGAKLLGRQRTECRVVIIGDTPRDIAAADAIGAESVVAATGGHTLDELRAAGPTALFEDFTDPRALGAIAG